MPSERDDLGVEVLERLEQPVEPDPDFADALLELLLAEVAAPPRHTIADRLRRGLASPARLRAAAGATAAVLAAVGVGAFLALRTVETSALAAIRDAQQRAAAVPSFRAVVSHRLAGELALGTVAFATGDDWVSVSELSYGGESRWRRVFRDSVSSRRRVVWNGRSLGIERPEQRRYYLYSRASGRTRAAAERLSPLATLSPRFRLFPVPPGVAPETYFRESCKVGPEGEIAGRPARTVTCGERAFRFSLWLDRETGLLLKLTTPGDELEVRTIEFDVRFGAAAFRPEPPPRTAVVRIGGRR